MSISTTRTISVLGCTGSIGTQVLDVAERLGERISVFALAGGSNVDLLAEQVGRFRPKLAVAATREGAAELARRPECHGVEVLAGQEGMCAAASATDLDTTVVGVQGFAGLRATIAAAEKGKNIAIASKEVLVAAKAPVRRAVLEHGATLVPIDSEHSAIFQCLVGEPAEGIEALILTASGGPFARATDEQMASITPAEALNHPTWKMGKKITVDSATLMNKGLEILEAEALFGVRPDQVEVVVHPKSIVHSLVRFKDGSVKAQLGRPDMRGPIQYSLLYPERPATGLPALDLMTCGPLEFYPPNDDRFPALRVAREAAAAGGTIPAVMSAADDVAVEAFLQGAIGFLEIVEVVEEVLARSTREPAEDLEVIIEADRRARRDAQDVVAARMAATAGAGY